MGKMQRTKGASFERAIALALSGALGRDVKRHLGQARDGGYDILATPFVVECKRRKSLKTIYGWMRQCIAAQTAAQAHGEKGADVPLVIVRADNEEALAVLRLPDFLNLIEPMAAAFGLVTPPTTHPETK